MPAAFERLGDRLIVTGGEQQQVARLVAVQSVDCRGVDLTIRRAAGEFAPQDAIDQPGYAERKNRVHVIPQFPLT